MIQAACQDEALATRPSIGIFCGIRSGKRRAGAATMLRNLLRRRARPPRTNLASALPRTPRDRGPRWRRSLAWAALVTLVASALYFSIAERDVQTPAPVLVR
jgi:hypothetical protein